MRSYLLLDRLLLALVIISHGSFAPANMSAPQGFEKTDTSSVAGDSAIDISLRTPSGSTITFQPDLDENNGDTQVTRIPHLVLKRNGALTAESERTLLVSVNNLSIPASGLLIELTIETEHGDPDIDAENSRIDVWREIRFIPYTNAQEQSSVDFTITFDEVSATEGKTIPTPSDYFAYRVSLTNAQGEKLHEVAQEYAFLLENQWTVPLPKVLEDSADAAPDRLIVYYCDMFPFQRDQRDLATRLKRNEVERYIQIELLPAMLRAFQVHSNVWGMPWYEEWSNYRTDEDPKSLSVALAAYPTWYHGPAPTLGYESISIRVNWSFGEYASLTDGIMGVFHHELFHNQQRNISLHFGGHRNLSGKDEAWEAFSEGTAVLASVVGQPSVEFAPVIQPRSYVKRVRGFLGQDGFIGGGLNKSYTEIPYHTALYWRFLYEHCGGLMYSNETPHTGMVVIRHILEILYQGKVVDINSSSDVVSALPRIVDLALQETPACDFGTYEESVLRFSEAVYRLRLQNGGNTIHSGYQASEFFDPDHLYPVPNAEKYSLESGSDTLVSGSIPSSYGIDLVEVDLGTAPSQSALEMTFESGDGKQDEFCIQVLQIHAPNKFSDTYGAASLTENPEITCTEDGRATLEIDPMNYGSINDLGIVITRLDVHEDMDIGEYSLSIRSE